MPFGLQPFGLGPFGGVQQPNNNPDAGFGVGAFGLGPFGVAWADRVITDLKVFAGLEGPQIILNWTPPPAHIDSLQIYRKEGEFPKGPADPGAILVYDLLGDAAWTATKFSDEATNPVRQGGSAGPTAGVWYYYRIFTGEVKPEDGLADGFIAYDPLGGSEGFDLAYNVDTFDDFMWDLLPDVWGLLDEETSQQALTLVTDATTGERTVLTTGKLPEGFGRRFVRILALLLRRAFVHAAETHQVWDLERVRADLLRNIEWILQVNLTNVDTYRAWRSRIRDQVYRHRSKGAKAFLEIVAEQEARLFGGKPTASIEMHNRVLYSWASDHANPQNAAGLLWEVVNLGRVEKSDDPNTYCWSPDPTSSYNERGWRLYWDNGLIDFAAGRDAIEDIAEELGHLKPATVLAEVWEEANLMRTVP